MKKLCVIGVLVMMLSVCVSAQDPGPPPNADEYDALRVWYEVMQRKSLVHVPSSQALSTALRYFDLDEEQEEALDAIGQTYYEEAWKAILALSRDLDSKYVDRVAQVMSDEQREVYRQLVAVELERGRAIDTAVAEYEAAMADIMKAQGLEEYGGDIAIPRSRLEIVRLHLNLTDEQITEMKKIEYDSRMAWLADHQKFPRPAADDAEGLQAYAQRVRENNAEWEERKSEAIMMLVTEEQEKIIEAVENAAEECNGKISAALVAAKDKFVELVGEERYEEGRRKSNVAWKWSGDRNNRNYRMNF